MCDISHPLHPIGNSDYLKALFLSLIISTQFCVETRCARRISVMCKSRSLLQDNPLTTPSSRALLKKLIVSLLVKKLPKFYVNGMFITIFKGDRMIYTANHEKFLKLLRLII